jgi:hypothetical protein
VSTRETKALIEQAIAHIGEQVPALRNLKLVIRLQLRSHGGDVPIWRVELPGPRIERDPAGDARVDVTVNRTDFNKLADDRATLRDWVAAYDRGQVTATGDNAVIKLVGNVIARQLARSRG